MTDMRKQAAEWFANPRRAHRKRKELKKKVKRKVGEFGYGKAALIGAGAIGAGLGARKLYQVARAAGKGAKTPDYAAMASKETGMSQDALRRASLQERGVIGKIRSSRGWRKLFGRMDEVKAKVEGMSKKAFMRAGGMGMGTGMSAGPRGVGGAGRFFSKGGVVTGGKTRSLQKRLAGRKGYAARMKKKKSAK
jgi:hypothetical protein